MATSSSPKRGFTLVEVMVAITVVNVMVALFCHMFIAHNRLVGTLEEWCVDDPVYYLQPDADPLARTVAVPAALPRTAPELSNLVDAVFPYEVEVNKLDRDLAGLISRAYVTVKPDNGKDDENVEGDDDEEDVKKGKGKGKGKGKDQGKDD